MDRAIEQLGRELAGVGLAAGNAVTEQEERDILKELRNIPRNLNIIDELRGVDLEEIDELNNSMIRLRSAIQEFYVDASNRGGLNCGPQMKMYIMVRSRFEELRRAHLELLVPQHRAIMDWMTLPGGNMPNHRVVRAYDKPKGEPTFSKMVLNFAVVLVLSRMEWAEGYLTHLQEEAIVEEEN